jgi:hypothetical protein
VFSFLGRIALEHDMRRLVGEKIIYRLCVVGDAAIDGRGGYQGSFVSSRRPKFPNSE